ncbi:recombinase family protein [Amycolatopsis palatopharyngis]|uniref:recombinase family protein n=1 Tax=Amycolatopsis palatopharyngis TaxID=187982 RepID=UPI001FEBB968|nr:recombinase family protein [Amycolatopsis palatopharyngis]
MDAQVINEGRHQGGRAPYGYVVIDSGSHPNPRKAAEGFRLRVLVIEDATADVVRRIFAEYLDGNGDRAIANMLNREGIACPSASRPEQNRHRLADGWQSSTVRSILENPRYTGYGPSTRCCWTPRMWLQATWCASGDRRLTASFGHGCRRIRQSCLWRCSFKRSFFGARSLRAGWRRRKAERGGRANARGYLLRGLIRCGVCGRKMQGATILKGAYYRCTARTMARRPGVRECPGPARGAGPGWR